MAFNSKNCLPNITIRFLCSSFLFSREKREAAMVSTCSCFQITHPDVLCPSQGLYRTALNREHLSNQCWSQPMLQGFIFYRLLWKHQDTVNAQTSMRRGREDRGSNHHWHGWKGWKRARLDPQLLSWVHVAAKLYPRTPPEAAPCSWVPVECLEVIGDVPRSPVPSATQPSHLRRKAGAVLHQKMVRRSSENSTYVKRSLNFPMLAQVRILLCRVRQSVPHPSPGSRQILFFFHFFFF